MTGPAPDNCASAKLNVDWVFTDAGATRTYQGYRRAGRSPYDALHGAQDHNPAAQASLEQCRGWVETYLASRGDAVPPISKARFLTRSDCQCASVIPTGMQVQGGKPQYRVTGSCDPLIISVRFTNAMNETQSAWVNAGILSGGGGRTITAPNYELTSIRAIELKNADYSVSCPF
ncbi:hypothetical protein MOX02_54190 [Methylobacterium oxalidis]|uniref:Uncharacterized protein n=1 Tax=Methylobacterium oxalidis TaxID=944322 RepID=A0A512JBV3_9HYPH|nr:hypothetical protein MOX02_54190 [Methylobacterium oxalidis]GLS67674.1 hypothetical protein GCM10007888_60590 [Methylobacterium oxalidis]